MSESRTQLEEILELLLAEENEKAEEMLHEYVVAKARAEYENILDEDSSAEEDSEEAVDETVETDEDAVEETVETDEDAVEEKAEQLNVDEKSESSASEAENTDDAKK